MKLNDYTSDKHRIILYIVFKHQVLDKHHIWNIRYCTRQTPDAIICSCQRLRWFGSGQTSSHHLLTSFKKAGFSIDSPIHCLQTKRWKESTFAAKATKNHWKKGPCLLFCGEPPCFCCFVRGEKRPFFIVQVSTVEVMLCLAGVVWCPGLAEAPMPGSLSRGTGQGEGGLHREVVPKEKVLRQSWLQSGLGVKRR